MLTKAFLLKRAAAIGGTSPSATTKRCLSSRARVVVVGSGRMGSIRASMLYANPRFDLAGIVDLNWNGAKALADTYQTNAYVSLQDAISDLQQVDGSAPIDGIIVASPTFTHEHVITESANLGISVFTEKPVDETADKIEHLYDVAQQAGIDLCCGFQRRFDTSYATASQAVQNGYIGHAVTANLFFADHPCPPKEFLLNGGGNIIMDLAPHDVDYILHTLQDDVVSVYATGTSSTDELAAAGVHDNATMLMKFAKGTIVTLFMSRSATYGYDQRCEIFGEKGLVSVKNEHTHATTLSNHDGIHESKLKHSFPQRFHQAFTSEMDAFCDTLLLNTKWPVTADDCIRVQKVADAASLSIELDQPVELQRVDVPFLTVTSAVL